MSDKRDFTARLVVYDLPDSDQSGIASLVQWLRDKADEIEMCAPEDYAKVYTSKLMSR